MKYLFYRQYMSIKMSYIRENIYLKNMYIEKHIEIIFIFN